MLPSITHLLGFRAFSGGCDDLSKLELWNVYHLGRISEGDRWKTDFNTARGHYYLVMPFGLTNAPTVFQFLVNDVLHDMLNRLVFFYFDDMGSFLQTCLLPSDPDLGGPPRFLTSPPPLCVLRIRLLSKLCHPLPVPHLILKYPRTSSLDSLHQIATPRSLRWWIGLPPI